MKIDIENLGGIDKGSIELNDFTIFCGKNNSGKTYAMYLIYGLLNQRFNTNFDFVKPIVEKLRKDGSYCTDTFNFISNHKEEMIKHIEERFKDCLPRFFGVSNSAFTNTIIRLNFSDIDIKKALSPDMAHNFRSKYARHDSESILSLTFDKELKLELNDCEINDDYWCVHISDVLSNIIFFDLEVTRNNFLLPAERAGINLFYKELLSIRNLLLQEAQNDSINPMRLLKDVLKSRYAEPIKDYTQFLNNIGSNQSEESNYVKFSQLIQKDVLSGEYEVDDFGNVFFIPFKSKNKLPLHFSSSTVKTLFGLVFYLKHTAKEGDYLMIDEPELNLHPDNQRQVARILAQLVNAGLKVVVSTHSNYFIREVNNLIMLKNKFQGVEKLRKKYKYKSNELLSNKQVSAYLFDKNKIESMVIGDEGIIAKTFDSVTDELNQSSDDIYYTMQDAKETDD